MFKLDLSDNYYFPVSVEIPEDGKHRKVTFDAEFKRLTKSEIREIFDRLPGLGKEVENPIPDDEILEKVFVGWKGIVDGNGESLPYSETTRERVLDIMGVAPGIVRAWFNSLNGSKAKN